MTFPLGFWDVSLLTAITAIILLITSELLSPHYGKVNIQIDRRRLKNAAMTFSIIFLATVAIRIVSIILSP
jgi:hypothetical protein